MALVENHLRNVYSSKLFSPHHFPTQSDTLSYVCLISHRSRFLNHPFWNDSFHTQIYLNANSGSKNTYTILWERVVMNLGIGALSYMLGSNKTKDRAANFTW